MTVELGKPGSESESRLGPCFESSTKDLLSAHIMGVGQAEPFSAEVIDLSRGGATMAVSSSLAVDTEVIMTLQSGSQSIQRESRICWSRPSRDGWWIGVAFKEELNESEFDRLASRGFIERRKDARIEHTASMTARWELESVPTPVRLIDLSSGGFKMASPEAAGLGKRVLIATENHPGSPIVAKVQWQLQTSKGFDIGCAFIDKHGCRNLMRQLGIDRPGHRTEKVGQRSTRKMVGLALGVATAALAGCLMTIATQVVMGLLDFYR